MSSVIPIYDFKQYEYALSYCENRLNIIEQDLTDSSIDFSRNENSIKKKEIQDPLEPLQCFLNHAKATKQTIAPLQVQSLASFLKGYTQKTEGTLSSQSYFGSWLPFTQKLFGTGPLPQLAKLNEILNTLPQDTNSQLTLYQQSAIEGFRKEHAALFTVLKIETAATIVEAKQKICESLSKSKLDKLLPKAQFSDRSLQLITNWLRINQPNIFNRYLQIISAQFEKKAITSIDCLALACFIEKEIFGLKTVSQSFFYYKTRKLARSLQLDKDKQIVYLLADPDLSLFQDEGTFKKVANCVAFIKGDYRLNPEIAIYLQTKINNISPEQIHEDIKNTKREVEYCKQFIEIRGLAQFRTATPFTQEVENKVRVKRMSMIFTQCTGNLERRLYEDLRPISFSEQLIIAKDLLSGLVHLHQHRIVHADLKLPNALFTQNNTGVIIHAELCDFGFCFTNNEATPEKTTPPEVYSWGHGGTDSFTAPELYGKENFEGDHFAIDMWGMGCMLFQIYFRKPPAWKTVLDTHIQENFDDTDKRYRNSKKLEKTQKELKNQIQKEIEEQRKSLMQKNERTEQEQFLFIIYNMLRLKPEDRNSAQESLEGLKGLS